MGLLVLEGLDGSGKSTQFELLLEVLRSRPGGARKVKFPDYGSDSSALVKMYLNGEFGSDPQTVNAYAASAFYAVDRFASFQKDWKADFEKGVAILADCYTTANYIYQMGKLPEDLWGDYLAWVEDLEYGKLGLPRPDQVIFLDMPVEVSQRLMSQRYSGDEEKKDIHENHIGFLLRCAKCAKYAAERLGWETISCAKDGEPRPIEEIHSDVLQIIDR